MSEEVKTNNLNKKEIKEKEEIVTHSNDNISFIEKDRKKWPIVLLLVLLVLGGAFYYYYYVLTKPSTLFNKVIESGYNYLSNSINGFNDKTNENKKFEITGKAILTSSNLKLIAFNTLTTDLYIGVDGEKGTFFSDLKSSLFNVDMSGDAQDKLYKTKNVELDDQSLKVNDIDYAEILNSIKYLLDSNKEIILSSVEDTKVSKKPKMIKIGDKNIPIYEVKYISTKDNTKKTVKAILNNIISDQKSLEALVTLGYGNDVEKVKTLLEEKNKNIIITEDLEIILYLDILNNKLLEFDVNYSNKKLNIKLIDDDIVILYEDKNSDESKLNITMTYNKIENRIALEYFSKMYNKETNDFDDSKSSITLKVDSSNKDKESYILSFKYYDPDNTDKELFCIDANIELKTVNEIKEFDTSNAIDYDKLNDKEKSEIFEIFEGFTEEA